MSIKLIPNPHGGTAAGHGLGPMMGLPRPMNSGNGKMPPLDGMPMPAMSMMANMMNGKLFQFLQDRDLVVDIARRHRELTFSEETQCKYDKLDPSSPKVTLGMMMIWSDTANQVLREMCPDFPDLKGTPIGVFVIEMLLQKYENDTEVRRHLDFMYEFRSMMQSGNLRTGDKVPDIDLVDLNNEEVHLADLYLHTDKPTVVIASSLS
ncbi:uncharacterized protein LOC144448244 [Glandiceps talaboti]